MGQFGLGQPVPRTEDPRLLRGGGRYIDDLTMPGMAYGYVLRSLHAHAKIKSIDTSAAKAAPGVLAVLTGADWKAAGLGDLPVGKGEMKRGSEAMFRPPYPALAQDRVRWVGDYVAFVIAETLNQAIDAAELIEVDYEPLPAVVSAGDAAKPGMPLVWDDCPNNICYVHRVGDRAATDRAMAAAPHAVKQRFVINRVTAVTMEPRGCVGHYDGARNRYTIHSGLQRAFQFRREISSILKVPESRVHVIAGDIGGSFGMKTAVYNEAALVLFGSKVTGRPVKWVSTRSEAFLSDAQGRDNVTDAELALDRNGKFMALRVKTTLPVGAYLQAGGESSGVANIGSLAGVYTMPAMSVDVTTVFTNTNPMRPYRGNGRPEAGYVIERCPTRRRWSSPTIAVSSRRPWISRSRRRTTRDSKRAARRPRRAASCAASVCPIPSSVPPDRAWKGRRSASTDRGR
jgi:carbon-monoxide dehydrogenase large subunit